MMNSTHQHNVNHCAGLEYGKSVRARIINDDETTLTLLDMVEISHGVLVADSKYKIFRNLLTEIIMRTESLSMELKKVRKDELFKNVADNAGSNAETHILEKQLDTFIVELLRFLAMKILLENIPNASNPPTITTDLKLIPSTVIRDAWKAILLLPLLYSDVCVAMGCEGGLDLDATDIRFENIDETIETGDVAVRRSREDYRYTLDIYERVYLIVPPPGFWLRLTFDYDDEQRDTTFCDNFTDITEWMSFKMKELVNGQDETIPTSIKFDKVLYDI